MGKLLSFQIWVSEPYMGDGFIFYQTKKKLSKICRVIPKRKNVKLPYVFNIDSSEKVLFHKDKSSSSDISGKR